MLARLITLFVTVPLVELALLLYLGDKVGWEYALGLVVVTAVVALLALASGRASGQK